MTIRRAVDAGYSPWLGLLFFCSVRELDPDGDVSFDAERVALALGRFPGRRKRSPLIAFYSVFRRGCALPAARGDHFVAEHLCFSGVRVRFILGPTLSNGGALGTPV